MKRERRRAHKAAARQAEGEDYGVWVDQPIALQPGQHRCECKGHVPEIHTLLYGPPGQQVEIHKQAHPHTTKQAHELVAAYERSLRKATGRGQSPGSGQSQPDARIKHGLHGSTRNSCSPKTPHSALGSPARVSDRPKSPTGPEIARSGDSFNPLPQVSGIAGDE